MKHINRFCKEFFFECIVPILILAGSWIFAIWFVNILLSVVQ